VECPADWAFDRAALFFGVLFSAKFGISFSTVSLGVSLV